MNENEDAWDLICAGRFEEANLLAQEEALVSNSAVPLRNQIIALLHLGHYWQAEEVCNKVIHKNGESSSDYAFLGVVQWILKKQSKAIESWRRGLNVKYTDGAGGVEIPSILYFGAIELGDAKLCKEALSLLKKRLKSKRITNWPGPIACYLCDKINIEALLMKVSQNPILKSRELCQVYFYHALVQKKENNLARALNALKEVRNQSIVASLEYEYFLAINELNYLLEGRQKE